MKLGKNTGTRKDVFISEEDRRTHMHVIGATGTGKSKFLEHMIRQDILAGHGVCLIDPTGALYDDLVKWIESYRLYKKRNIILFDPSEEGWTFGFNPLMSHANVELSFLVDNMVNAFAKVWGGEDQNQTPRLKRFLRLVLYALDEKKLSLLEAQPFINVYDPAFRKYLVHDIADAKIREEWLYQEERNKRDLDNDLDSFRSRLMEFIAAPAVRNIIGQVHDTLNFKEIMEAGHILLVNLKPQTKVSVDNIHLLGSLIVNDLLISGLGREKGAKPFYLYIDECSLFINDDIGRILDLCRKFGPHLILSHQFLHQLKEAGEKIYYSVMTNARTKVIFGGLSSNDAEVLVKDVFTQDIELQEWKGKLTKPTITGYNRAWFENYSTSRGYSSGSGEGVSYGSGQNISTGMSTMAPDGGLFGAVGPTFRTDSTSEANSSFSGQSRSRFESYSESDSQGMSEGLEPIFEDLPVESYSLEEQIWRRMVLMMTQNKQHAIIKKPYKKSQFMKIATVEDGFANTDRLKRFKEKAYLSAYYTKAKEEVEHDLALREEQLKMEVKKFIEQQKNPPTPEPTVINPATSEGEEVKESFKEPLRRRRKI